MTLDVLGHHRGRGLADRAAAAAERDVADPVAVDVERELDLVAAKRVVPARGDVRRLELPSVARILVMVEDNFLVEIIEGHDAHRATPPKISRACPSAPTSASTSC